ncbi:MAG: YbbR-like domain-containing protein [Chloroflexota bacterium]
MMRWLATNLRTFGLAFVLALAVWVSAVTAADPDEVNTYPQPIPVEIVGQDSSLILTGNYARQIEVILRAPRSVWEQLIADTSSVRAVIDLSGLGAGDHSVPIQVQIGAQPVRLIAVTPAEISLTLEPLVTVSQPISLVINGEPAIGYQAGTPELTPTEVVISGPASLAQNVQTVRISINMNNTREDIDQTAPLQVLDRNNRAISGLTITPETAKVTIPVSQQGGYRDVAVKVVVEGQVASGYRLNSISVFPPVVTLFSSDPQLVSAQPGFVETAPLDLNDAKNDLVTRLDLTLPDGISVVGEQSVLVEVAIDAIEGSLTLSDKPIEVVGLGDGLSAEVSPLTVDVILSGPLPLLETLTAQDVRVVVDVTDLSSGTYQLTPTVEFLIAGIRVETLLPATVQVTIIFGTPTPNP